MLGGFLCGTIGCIFLLCLWLAVSTCAHVKGNRDVPSGAWSAGRMRATLQAPVCPAGTRKRGGRHRISPDLLRLHAESSEGAGLLRNSGRCTSFSLNLHTSLLRHPHRLPRPTVVEALRKEKPRCSKGALALAPRRDFTLGGNLYSPPETGGVPRQRRGGMIHP